uniref:Activin_recp domain-containing protein n=1 Tax=Strongyloides papillosus TaxID=174720 RepID=A0A0N5C3U2_STREA
MYFLTIIIFYVHFISNVFGDKSKTPIEIKRPTEESSTNNSTSDKTQVNKFVTECYTSRTYAYFFYDFITSTCVPPTKYCISIDGYTHMKPYHFGRGCSNEEFSQKCDKISYNGTLSQASQEIDEPKIMKGMLNCCTENLCNFKVTPKFQYLLIIPILYFIFSYF